MKGTIIILLALIGIVYFVENSLVKFFIIGILSLIVIMKATNYLVNAITHYATLTGIGDYLIGLLVVSMGTTLPDLTMSIMSSISKSGNLILGDVVGSNILDITIVLGVVAIAGKEIVITDPTINKNLMVTPLIMLIPLILAYDGVISRLDGILLLIVFILYFVNFLRHAHHTANVKKSVQFKEIWIDMVVFLGALIAVLMSARWLVHASIQISILMNIHIFTIGLLFVALGMTVPELTVGIMATMKKKHHLSFGSILGAAAMNNSLVIGIGAMINPIVLESTPEFFKSVLFMMMAVGVGIFFLAKKRITWRQGLILLAIYAIFLFYQFIFI